MMESGSKTRHEGNRMSRSRAVWLAATPSPESLAAGGVFEAMLDGWRDQQLARSLNEVTIDARELVVRRFRSHAQSWPWEWLPGHLESWVGELRVEDHRTHSTIRSPARRRFVLCLRVRPGLWMVALVHPPVRCGTQPGLSSGEPGHSHVRVRRSPGAPVAHPGGAAVPVRRGRRRRRCHPFPVEEGMGAGLPGCHHVEGRLWVGTPAS